MRNVFLKIINFHNVSSWDVKRYTYDNKMVANYKMIRLKSILTQYKKILPKNYVKNNRLQIVSKINFSGLLFLRPLEDTNTFKGELHEIPTDSITYSKINVRHGCVYYNELGKSIVASSEYPVFTFDQNKILGTFLHMFLRTKYIKDYLNTRTTGISKARIKVGEFLDIQIPLPDLSTQKRLIEEYNDKIRKIESANCASPLSWTISY